ncbi:MAG: CSLREA domain-containing protein [Chloroflexi bacterium]|nr:CSLREA domain-containing protein [Chloroflexota bacterium]
MCKRTFNKNICSLSMLRVMLLVALVAAAWVLVPTGLALADGITVNTTVDQDGTGAECSLREAIRTANTDTAYGGCAHSSTPGADTITFNAGLSGGTIIVGTQLGISSTLTIDGNVPITVSGNSAVRVFEIESGGVVTLSHLSIINGSSTGVGGGGILVNTGTTLRVEYCLLRDNVAGGSDSGGAIQSNTSAVLTVVNSTFYQNQAAGGLGGGISSAGTLVLQNNTLVGNSALYGGALGVFDGDVDMRNNILTNSTADGDCARLGGVIHSDINNLIEADSIGSGGAFACNITLNAADPFLAPLGNYGGQTQSYALLPGSPAIDAGNNATCPSTDQRDKDRPVNGTCDIGAFESQGFYFDNLGGDGQSTYYGTTFDQPLSLTVVATNAVEPVGAGGIISFSAPLAGASITTGTFTTTTSLTGAVSVPVHANGTLGSYVVTATTRGASMPALFDLTNNCDVTVVNTDDSGAGSLRQAISDACDGGQIDFNLTLPATITLTSGELSIAQTLTLNGPGKDLLAVSANNASRVFKISGSIAVTMTGLTIRDGKTAGSGGGIHINTADLSLYATRVISNMSGDYHVDSGGGIAKSGTGTLLCADGTEIRENVAQSYGGGIYMYGGTVILKDSYIVGNQVIKNAAGFYGVGGGLSAKATTLVITNTRVMSNVAEVSGGGLYFDANRWELHVSNSYISGNQSAQWGGGASLVYGTVWMTDTQISNNTALAGGGGGLLAARDVVVRLHKMSITGNKAKYYGSGISCDNITNGSNHIVLVDSQVSGNGSTSSYAAIYASDAITLTDTQVFSNVNTGISVWRGHLYMSGGKLRENSQGGLRVNYGGSAILSDTQVFSNSASMYQAGGGVAVINGYAELINTSVRYNKVDVGYGGGLRVEQGAVGLKGTQFTGNTAVDGGDAVYNASGIITTHSALTITGEVYQAGGTFVGNGYDLRVADALVLAGGDFYAPSNFALTGPFTHTGGTYYQTRDVNGSGDVAFPQAGGVILNANAQDLGSTAVALTAGMTCTGVTTDVMVSHCYEITPTYATERDATLTLFYREDEIPTGQACTEIEAYRWDSTWDNLLARDAAYGTAGRLCGDDPQSIQVSGVTEFSPFAFVLSGRPVPVVGSPIYLDGDGNLVLDLSAGNAHGVTFVLSGTQVLVTDASGELIAGDGVTQEDVNTVSIPFANGTGRIWINGEGGDDTVLLEDMGPADQITYNYNNLTDGSILFGSQLITYTGLASVWVDTRPITDTFNLTSTHDVATLTDLGDGMSRLSGDTFADTDFGNPQANGALTFNLGDGDDTLILSSASLATDTTFIVDGQGGQDVLEWATSDRILQAGILDAQVNANLHFSGSTLPVVIGGTEPGVSHDAWRVTGEYPVVTLDGVTLALELADGYTPAPGDEFVLIDIGLGGHVQGTFVGLPEGAVVTLGGVPCKISYMGGDLATGTGQWGNDVVLVANTAPTISNISNQATEVSVPLTATFTISDTDDPVGDLWTYAESSNLALVNGGLAGTLMTGSGMSIDCTGTQCTLWITPTTGITGTTTITVTVDDGLSTANDTFVLAVGVNAPPEFTSSPPLTGTVGTLYTYDVTASDPNVDNTLTITATTKPTWLALTDNGDGTATLSGTPTLTDTYDVVLEVSDGEDAAALTDTQSFSIVVEAVPVADYDIFLPLVLRNAGS